MVKRFLKELLVDDYKEILAHHEVLQETPSRFSLPTPRLNPHLESALAKIGIKELYTHQVEAIKLVREKKNPVSITPTASGKTLTYNIPIIEQFLEKPEGHALYLFPLKALEQDQLKKLKELTDLLPVGGKLKSAIYDGDTPPSLRAKIRSNFPRFLLTNPEMLHLAVSQYHKGWDKFLRNLRFVVVDELHTYKGIFGSHMSQLFKRLNRICRYYGSNPQYIASSATINNPVDLAENLTGRKFTLIDQSGAPISKRHYVFMNPDTSVYSAASKLFRLGLKLGLKTIVFTKARQITELIYQWTLEAEPDLKGSISAYRAGFLPEERREIESSLESGKLSGVISTSALEMGIDIGNLDLCILVGYPGTISATFQRGGRVGRKSESAVVMLAQANALDQYFMKNPKDFFGRSYESAMIDSNNKYIVKEHIECAAAEIPITVKDEFYGPQKYASILDELVNKGRLQLSAEGDKWFPIKSNPHRNVDLRASGSLYTISDSKGKIIGSVSGGNVFSECHPGAIYLHRGKQYLVSDLDIKHRNITVNQTDVPYYTSANSQKDTEIIETFNSRELESYKLHHGRLKVTEWITGYDKKRLHTQERLGTFPLDLPEQSYETVGIWMEIPRRFREWCENEDLNFMGGIHGIEHLMLALVPLFALCDRGDMGGISMVEHPGVKGPAIFFYDGYPGGIGLAERLYDVFEKLENKALSAVKGCKCIDGCPSCIHSPKCGSGNHPLDKKAVIGLLELFTLGKDIPLTNTQEKLPATDSERIFVDAPEKENQKINTTKISKSPVKTRQDKILVLDIETQLSADEVGGWGNIADMLVAVAVTSELNSRKMRNYYEEDVDQLIDALYDADLIIGFNLIRFDYTVLKHYGLKNPEKLKTLDILVDINKILGHRLSLDAVCSATLNASKSADGLKSIEWFKAGKLDLVTKYCLKDVELTRDLYLFGKENGYILYNNKNKGLVRIPVKW